MSSYSIPVRCKSAKLTNLGLRPPVITPPLPSIMERANKFVANIINPKTNQKLQIYAREKVEYAVLEISPSKMTSNTNVKWLLSDFARLFKPLHERVTFNWGFINYSPAVNIWWEVMIHKGQIRFFLVIPDKDDLKHSITRQVMKTWKQANVKVVKDYMPEFPAEHTSISKLTLKHHSALSLDTQNPNFSILESLLNAKHFVRDDDVAMLQIGMQPMGNSWNESAMHTLDTVSYTHLTLPTILLV